MGIVLNWSSNYPASIDDTTTNFPTVTDNVHDVLASHVNELASGLISVQTVVGGFRTTAVADPLSPSNGDVLTYNNISGEWEAVAPTAGTVTNLQDAYDGGGNINLAAATPIVVTANAAIDEMLRLVESGIGWRFYKNTVLGPDGSVANPAYSFLSSATTGLSWDGTDLEMVIGGTAILSVRNSFIATTQEIRTVDGAANNPGYTFGAPADCGIYKVSSGVLGITTDDVLALRVEGQLTSTGEESAFAFTPTISKVSDSYRALLVNVIETAVFGVDNRLLDLQVGGISQAYVHSDGTFHAGYGSITDPSLAFVGEENTGVFRPAAGAVGITASGTEVFRMTSSYLQIIVTGGGTPAAPSLIWGGDVDTGIFKPGQDSLSITTGGAAIAEFKYLDDATGDENAVEITATINKLTSGNYNALVVNADTTTTNGAPGTDNHLFDLQLNGVTQAYANEFGAYAATPSAAFTGSTTLAEPFGLGITATLSLTDTAESTALGIFVTETTHTTTGATRLIHAQVGGSNMMELFDTGQLFLPTDGSATAPVVRFGSSGVTGLYSDASSRLSVTINSAERFRFVSAQLLSDANGTASGTTYSWIGDDNTGTFRNAADELGLSAGGNAVVLDGTGTVNLSPDTDNSYELGTSSLRWATLWSTTLDTGDINLRSLHRDMKDVAYTIVEGRDGLYLRAHHTGKSYKLRMDEVSEAPLTKSELKAAGLLRKGT